MAMVFAAVLLLLQQKDSIIFFVISAISVIEIVLIGTFSWLNQNQY